ncbi:phage head morphogenesis protein [Campylobacter hyointestinalis subsp. hyointestinalis]|uniref:phage head morphogenesis protein n=1 Tax=Campylobacter hyointestinalis TaxID=198 RepID=UPI000CE4A826|nr:phage minor head protein [Campylobacter hyointestinalis]PPB57593.1 phage head morphogenesis protein [Campylobacter hyointestinalis subsp. hyointestinalis]QCT99348.1 phage head morphogenesis protein [Campylobacter hyointestinalis subsp. hyointestinalis]
MKFSFFDEPTSVVEYLQSKKPELHFDYDEIAHDAHKRAFTIAKMTDLDLLKDMQSSLSNAFKNGVGFEEWKRQIKPKLAARGWLGETQIINPKTGEIKKIYVGNRRLKTIYNTNMRTAYAQARYQSQMRSSGEYFRYTAVLDRLTRPVHKRMHGVVLPKTDKFWDKNYPPNDWNCRCKVQVLSKEQLKSRGITPLADGSFLKDVAGKDFAYNPGKSADKLDEILSKKQEGTLAVLRPKEQAKLKKRLDQFEHERDLYTWQKGLDNMVNAILTGQIIKDKIYQVAQVGKLKPNIVGSLKELNVETKAQSIAIYQNTISHITRDNKPKSKEPSADEIKAIVSVFDEAKHVFYDMQEKVLLYFYGSLQDDKMANYAAIRLDYVLKKFRTDNFIATISKMPLINYKSILSDKKRYKRVK